MTTPHQVVFVLFPGVDLLDVTGTAEVFTMASMAVKGRRAGYQLRMAAAEPGTGIPTMSGVRLVADQGFDEIAEHVDTLIVPGGLDCGPTGALPVVNPEVVGFLRRVAPGAKRIAAMCTGVHALASAGMLDGRVVTAHWATAQQLMDDHPRVRVATGHRFLQDGPVWSSSGSITGLEMAIALVAQDFGEEAAHTVTRWMTADRRKAGGTSGVAAPAPRPEGDRWQVDQLCSWIAGHLTEDLAAPALARRMHLSERQFVRVFRRETGATPASYVKALRVRAACDLLVRTERSLDEVAAMTGFGSVQTLHRAFRSHLDVTPHEYRRRLAPSRPAADPGRRISGLLPATAGR